MKILALLVCLAGPAAAGVLTFGNNSTSVDSSINGTPISPSQVNTSTINASQQVQILRDGVTAAQTGNPPDTNLLMAGQSTFFQQAWIMSTATGGASGYTATGDLGSQSAWFGTFGINNSRSRQNPQQSLYSAWPSSSVFGSSSDGPLVMWADTNGNTNSGTTSYIILGVGLSSATNTQSVTISSTSVVFRDSVTIQGSGLSVNAIGTNIHNEVFISSGYTAIYSTNSTNSNASPVLAVYSAIGTRTFTVTGGGGVAFSSNLNVSGNSTFSGFANMTSSAAFVGISVSSSARGGAGASVTATCDGGFFATSGGCDCNTIVAATAVINTPSNVVPGQVPRGWTCQASGGTGGQCAAYVVCSRLQ